MSADVFDRIDPPIPHVGLPINEHAVWLTWSQSFRRFLRQSADVIRNLPAPGLVRVAGLAKYNSTFSYWPRTYADFGRRILSFSRSLIAVAPESKLFLLHGLFTPDLDGPGLHKLFATFRDAFVQLAGNERAAMYTPLGQTGSRIGDFPLHADLYIPRVLFNVFEAVPDDGSGASLFLPVPKLRLLMPEISSLPYDVETLILSLLEEDSDYDGFELLDDLLHGPGVWVGDLEAAMERNQLRIKLHSGEGYLLDDRKWLHGRDAATGGVPPNRLHRLVFSPPKARST
jgi:hypothetical protein